MSIILAVLISPISQGKEKRYTCQVDYFAWGGEENATVSDARDLHDILKHVLDVLVI
jgi:hypothetical protein